MARIAPANGAWSVGIDIACPLVGWQRFRLEVRARAGELEPYEFELPGTLALDLPRIRAWFGGLRPG